MPDADEKVNDPDTEYLVGCATAGLAGVAVLVPPIVACLWDSYGAKSIYQSDGLTFLVGGSAACSFIFAVFASLRKNIAGAFGAFGGIICGGTYWFLHLQQTIAKAPSDIGRYPEYQDSTMWLVPLAWLLLGAVASFLPTIIRNSLIRR
jgi:hypothetical protein